MSGGSKSTSSNETTNQDNRIFADNGAVALSNSAGANVQVTDLGAISKALDFAAEAGKDVSGNFKSVIALNENTFGKVIDLAAKSINLGVQQNASSAQNLATAYQDAKGGQEASKQIAMLGIGAAVAVAFALTRKAV